MIKMQFILTDINSNMKIEPQAFKLYTRVVTDLIVRNSKWYRIIPTLHTVSENIKLCFQPIFIFPKPSISKVKLSKVTDRVKDKYNI